MVPWVAGGEQDVLQDVSPPWVGIFGPGNASGLELSQHKWEGVEHEASGNKTVTVQLGTH